jgi:hypothetical protein
MPFSQETEGLMRRLMIAALALFTAGNVSAQELIGAYVTVLSVQDMYNSDGDRLTEFCQVVQQDRANYHRFKQRDANDEGDPFFRSPEARQVIGRLCVVAPGQDYIRKDVMRGVERYVWVQVFESGGRISAIVVNEAGD